ncbi:YbhN family protein [Bacillus songklensis]|uniref:Phosphatidylglycerol lysyltransferase n=1 Tax=Bacillus songklensis TaxID=1069116 RepID=A0ABV8AYX5_9BACI
MKLIKKIIFIVGILLVLAFCYISLEAFDWSKLHFSLHSLWNHPQWLFLMTFFYTLAFLLRAIAWKMYMKGKITLSSAVVSLFYSLAINHLFPVKAGDMVRIGIIRNKNKNIAIDEAIHSVVMMRLFDMLSLIGIAAIGLYLVAGYIRFFVVPFSLLFGLGLCFCLALFVGLKKARHLGRRQFGLLRESVLTKQFPFLLVLIWLSWISEGVVVYSIANVIGCSLSAVESVWVNSMTIGGQVFQITPGGIATYETIMSGALTLIKLPLEDSYIIALTSHAYKFIYSYAAGIIALLFMPITVSQLRLWMRKKGEKQS